MDSASVIWEEFNSNKTIEECAVCSHAEKLLMGGRPRGKKSIAETNMKRSQSSFDQEKHNTTVLSVCSNSYNDTSLFDDSTSNQSMYTPLESTPIKKARFTVDMSTSPIFPLASSKKNIETI